MAKKQTAAAMVQFFEGKIAFQEYAEAAAAKKLDRARSAKKKIGALLSPGKDIAFSEVASVVAKKEELRGDLAELTEFIATAAAPDEEDHGDWETDEEEDEGYEPTFCGADGKEEKGDDDDEGDEEEEEYDDTATGHRAADDVEDVEDEDEDDDVELF